ncbi:MAG: restriction endonuclease subunit S [Candidatus Brocadiaceae bacterium]|uniref:restriction endonuclease subunit S n=1 Tax=Candidatus Wunengus sp. YC61 TaxID=3367698 RepID=UPI00271AE7B4|nr:restriction endonuclease subunit S [Candidatus Brocadiaceae bacterium]
MSSQNFPKAFAVWFKDLRRWDPASFHEIAWHWPKDVMQPIGRILSTRKEKVDRTRFTFSDLQPITIHFDGSIDRRNVDATREYTMDLFFARSGDIIVAKIDLKNGAVAIVPDDWENVVVTGHFAVYKPDRTKIIPEYFHRIIQTSFFKAHLWRNKVGAEGRKEVKLDYFESLEIPIPPIPIQKEIMARWQKAQEEIKTAKERVEDVKQLIETKLLQKSGTTLPPVTLRKGAFVLEWRKFERWDTFFYREDFINLVKQIKSRRHATLGEILNFTSRSWKTSDFQIGYSNILKFLM